VLGGGIIRRQRAPPAQEVQKVTVAASKVIAGYGLEVTGGAPALEAIGRLAS